MGIAGAILVGFGSSLDGIGPHGVLGKESAGTSIQRQPQAAPACVSKLGWKLCRFFRDVKKVWSADAARDHTPRDGLYRRARGRWGG